MRMANKWRTTRQQKAKARIAMDRMAKMAKHKSFTFCLGAMRGLIAVGLDEEKK
jgi:hypothetical protein